MFMFERGIETKSWGGRDGDPPSIFHSPNTMASPDWSQETGAPFGSPVCMARTKACEPSSAASRIH